MAQRAVCGDWRSDEPPSPALTMQGGAIAMAKLLNADHHTNRLLAILEPEDFASLAPALELVDLPYITQNSEERDQGKAGHEPGWSLANTMEKSLLIRHCQGDEKTSRSGKPSRGQPAPDGNNAPGFPWFIVAQQQSRLRAEVAPSPIH